MNPTARTTDLVIQETQEDLLIYDRSNNKAFCFNATSAVIWKHCDGINSLSEIARFAGKELGGTVEESIVKIALDQFQRNGLLKPGTDLSFAGKKLSRRRAIRAVGFASVVSLPLVSSITAPSPAMAQSIACPPLFAVCGAGCCAVGGFQACCSGTCTSVVGNPQNCGGCGNVCPAGTSCAGPLGVSCVPDP